jgi:VWFA-related protein
MMRFTSRWVAAGAAAALVALGGSVEPVVGQEGFRFKSGVELINVTATVIDRSGRFAGGLRQEDFVVYEDDKPVEVTHFSAERTPVSLGIVLDTSGSMAGEKIEAARDAIDRFLGALPDPQDEFFMYRFSADPYLVNDWTSDRQVMTRNLARLYPTGGTAMYDAVAEAVPMAQGGQNRKKAIVLISDVKQLVRETEVLVYAVGIDGQGESTFPGRPSPPVMRPPSPIPFPIPGGRGQPRGLPFPVPSMPRSGGGTMSRGADDRVNVAALREITDDSGGRTEIVRDPRDLDPATLSIADELSKQYYIGYPSPGHRDGRWHSIRVEVRDPNLKIRARRGYIATP